IVSPPPIVNAPSVRKYVPRSTRLFGFGVRPAADHPNADVRSHQGAERMTRASIDENTHTGSPGFFGCRSTRPAQPAKIRIAPIPMDVPADARAAATPIVISVSVPAVDFPSRYTATAKSASTTGPNPYSAPRAMGVRPSDA